VSVENDANAAALGELWLGAGRGGGDWLLVTLGTGIGGGLVLGGRLHTGGGLASEPGHVVVEPDGLACSCGGRGCVETLASGGAARRRALEAGLPAAAPGDLERLCELARRGPGPEADLLHAVGRDLGRGLGPVVSLLDLDTFLFGGGFSAAFDLLEVGLRTGVDERSFGSRGRRLRLERASLGPSAGWIGAARLAFPAELSCRP
jgi:glucokinase